MYTAKFIIEIDNGDGGHIRRSLGVAAEDFDTLQEALIDMVFYKATKLAEEAADEENFAPASKETKVGKPRSTKGRGNTKD